MVMREPSLFDCGNFRLACVAYEWRHRQGDAAMGFVLANDGAVSGSVHAAFPECRVFQLDEMMGAFPKGAEIVERAMLNLGRMVKHPVESIKWNHPDLPYALFTPLEDKAGMLGDLQEIGYIKIIGVAAGGQSLPNAIRIAPRGWQQIEKWRGRDLLAQSKQAFIAMWFSSEMNPVYKEGIEPAVKGAGYEPRRIDFVEHNNDICDEIVAEIRKSRFVVADFTAGLCKKCPDCGESETCRAKARQRGGVYFEAGFALGLGIPVIWTVRKDQMEQVHFTRVSTTTLLMKPPKNSGRNCATG
jgi:hypothetical protein